MMMLWCFAAGMAWQAQFGKSGLPWINVLPKEVLEALEWSKAWWCLNVSQRTTTIWLSQIAGTDVAALSSMSFVAGTIMAAGTVAKKALPAIRSTSG